MFEKEGRSYISRQVQMLPGADPFTGFRKCYQCGTSVWMSPSQFPYQDVVVCSCSKEGQLAPITDRDIIHCLQKEWKMADLLSKFRQMFNF